MANMNSYPNNVLATGGQTDETTDDTALKYVKEWSNWREQLKPYWRQIDKNQEMYEFYKREGSETSSDVSLNTPFAIVESMVARMNDTKLNVTVRAKGMDGLDDFEDYVAGIIEDAVTDKSIARVKGSFRKEKEVYERDFFAKGNAVAEENYCYKTYIDKTTGKEVKKVLCDNPYITTIYYKNYTFNPSMYFDNSDVKYIEKYTTLDALKNEEFKEIEEELDGKTVKIQSGKYINLDKLAASLKDDKLQDAPEEFLISGERKIKKKNGPIHILERWEGPKLCVVANKKVIIREAYDPKKTGNDGILTSMNYKVVDRPYAYGEIDAIYKTVRAQDTIMNQSIEMANRYLRPGFLVKDTSADLEAIVTLIESGGVTYGDPTGVGPLQVNPPPQGAFQSLDLIQQAIERAARFSPYSSGVTVSQADKTQGTATGIASLQGAAEPNFEVKLDALEESFMQPLGADYLKMIANLMSSDDVRYTLFKGKSAKWVSVTKKILMGQCTIQDLIDMEMMEDQGEDIQKVISEMGIEPDATDIYATVVFDVEWLVDMSLDNQSQAEKQNEIQQDSSLIQLGLQMGLLSPSRSWEYMAKKQGLEDIEDLMMTPQEQQQKQQADQAQQQMQMQHEMNLKQAAPPQAPEAPQQPQSNERPPSVSISFKDLPPLGQAQAAAEAGINLPVEYLMQYQQEMANQEAQKQMQQAQMKQPQGPPNVG